MNLGTNQCAKTVKIYLDLQDNLIVRKKKEKLMFLIAISKTRINSEAFTKCHLETTTVKIGNIYVLLVFDTKLSSFKKTDSFITLTESLIKIKKMKITDILNLNSKTFLEHRLLTGVIIELKKKEINIKRPLLSPKPLYYHINKNGTVFYCSTHIKLLKKIGLEVRENKKAMAEYLLFGWVMPPNTVYQDIKIAARGESLIISLKKNNILLYKKNFSFRSYKEMIQNEKIIVKKILHLIKSLIVNKNFKDKIAVSFGGGLDSTILAKILNDNNMGEKVFSMNYPFEDSKKSIEKTYAITAGKALKLNHTHLEVSPKDYLNRLIEMIEIGEEPCGLYISNPLFCALLKEAPKNIETVIFGNGADVLFGYDHLIIFCLTENKRAILPFLLKLPLIEKIKFIIRIMKLINSTKLKLDEPSHLIWKKLMHGDQYWIKHKFNISAEEIVNKRTKIIKPFLGNSLCDLYSIICLLNYMDQQDALLSKFGEYYNRKVFSPFINDLLVMYSFQIPWNMKLTEPKYILRLVARKLNIPEFIITRKKSGFAANPEDWALPGKMFEPIVTLCEKLIGEDYIRRMQSKDRKKFATLWFIINYAIWKEIFIKNKSSDELKKQLNEIYNNFN